MQASKRLQFKLIAPNQVIGRTDFPLSENFCVKRNKAAKSIFISYSVIRQFKMGMEYSWFNIYLKLVIKILYFFHLFYFIKKRFSFIILVFHCNINLNIFFRAILKFDCNYRVRKGIKADFRFRNSLSIIIYSYIYTALFLILKKKINIK